MSVFLYGRYEFIYFSVIFVFVVDLAAENILLIFFKKAAESRVSGWLKI